MDKYQEALDLLREYAVKYARKVENFGSVMNDDINDANETLQELVDKETSKKSTFYGYDVGLLTGVAMELAEQGITYDMLKNSTDMYRKGFDDCSERCSILHKLIFKEEE